MIVNLRNNMIISSHPQTAISLYMRTRGMIGRKFDLDSLDGMVFERCASIHTCFMSIPLDVIFTDKNNIVTKVISNVAPWRLAFGAKSSYKVIELPVGVIEKTQTLVGDVLQINSISDKEKVSKKTTLSKSLTANNQAVTMK